MKIKIIIIAILFFNVGLHCQINYTRYLLTEDSTFIKNHSMYGSVGFVNLHILELKKNDEGYYFNFTLYSKKSYGDTSNYDSDMNVFFTKKKWGKDKIIEVENIKIISNFSYELIIPKNVKTIYMKGGNVYNRFKIKELLKCEKIDIKVYENE